MKKFYQIRGFASVPVIVAGAVLAVGLVGGLVYEFGDNLNLTLSNKDNLLAQVASDTCVDSDNGINFSVKGTATGKYAGEFGSYSDFCADMNVLLKEYYCENSPTPHVVSQENRCSNGCSNGVCLADPVIAALQTQVRALLDQIKSLKTQLNLPLGNEPIILSDKAGLEKQITDLLGEIQNLQNQLTNPVAKPPSVDLKINNSDTPTSVNYDSVITASWTSTGAIKCIGAGYTVPFVDGGVWANPSVSLPLSGSKSLYARWQGIGYYDHLELTLECQDSSGNWKSDKVSIPVSGKSDLVIKNLFSNEIGSIQAEYCNNDIASTNDTFLIKYRNEDTKKEFPGNSYYRFSVPSSGQCATTGSVTCGLIDACGAKTNITAIIDWEQRVNESNENNNTLTKIVENKQITSTPAPTPTPIPTPVVTPTPTPVITPTPTDSAVSSLQEKINMILEQIKKLQEQLSSQQPQSSAGSSQPVPITPVTSVTPETQPGDLGFTGEETESFSYTWNRDLYYGLTNDKDVQALQNALILEGVYKGPVTGNFFRLTRQAVIDFQKKHNFTAVPGTGYVGFYTRKALNELYSK